MICFPFYKLLLLCQNHFLCNLTVWEHCMVQINSSTLLLVGGTESVRAVEPSSKTYFYSLASNKWTEGPSMAEKRGRKVSISLSLSLSHTHTHTLSLSLSLSISPSFFLPSLSHMSTLAWDNAALLGWCSGMFTNKRYFIKDEGLISYQPFGEKTD